MSKYSAPEFALFLVDGYNLIASLSESVTMGKESITEQTNPFGVTSEEHTPINMEKGILEVNGGYFDPTADALHHQAAVAIGVSRIVCAGIEGNIIGKHFIGFEGALDTKYEIQDQRDNLTKANVSYLVSGAVNEGAIVQHLATFTVDWDTKTGGAGADDAPVDYADDPGQRPIPITSNSIANPTIVTCPVAHGLTTGQIILISGVVDSDPTINGERVVTVIDPLTFSVLVNVTTGGTGGSFVLCSTVAGGVGYLQVTAKTGFTGFVNSIMHSPDDSAYAALIAFTDLAAVDGPAKERKTVAGTIDRYLSNAGNVTGTGSVTVFCGFCRN